MNLHKTGDIRNDQDQKCGFVRNFTVKNKTLIEIIGIIRRSGYFSPEVGRNYFCAAFADKDLLGQRLSALTGPFDAVAGHPDELSSEKNPVKQRPDPVSNIVLTPSLMKRIFNSTGSDI